MLGVYLILKVLLDALLEGAEVSERCTGEAGSYEFLKQKVGRRGDLWLVGSAGLLMITENLHIVHTNEVSND